MQYIIPIIEIIIIATVINYLLSFFWNTRSMDLIFGVIAFFFIFLISYWLPFPVLHRLTVIVSSVAVTAIIIIFQPELRVALSKLSLKSKKHQEITEFDKFLNGLADTVFRLAQRKVGALIVLENNNRYDELARKAIMINADFSPELLEAIVSQQSPLHDGAIIVRGNKILAAQVILPLIDAHQVPIPIPKTYGTRHRAAIGASVTTDALIIVVSEETGKVSLAREGIFTRGVKIDRFKGIINSLFAKDPEPQDDKKGARLWRWLTT